MPTLAAISQGVHFASAKTWIACRRLGGVGFCLNWSLFTIYLSVDSTYIMNLPVMSIAEELKVFETFFEDPLVRQVMDRKSFVAADHADLVPCEDLLPQPFPCRTLQVSIVSLAE